MKFIRNKFIEDSFRDSSDVKLRTLEACIDDIGRAADAVLKTLRSGGKLMFCGNGGSAADCQHIATEFMVRLSHDIERPAIAAIALTTDSSSLTAGGNDIGFENIFARSVEGIGKQGDVLIGISTSGNSVNVINAVRKARDMGIETIGFLGRTGGKLKNECGITVCIPSDNVQRIQESHITVGHILCEIAERELYA